MIDKRGKNFVGISHLVFLTSLTPNSQSITDRPLLCFVYQSFTIAAYGGKGMSEWFIFDRYSDVMRLIRETLLASMSLLIGLIMPVSLTEAGEHDNNVIGYSRVVWLIH